MLLCFDVGNTHIHGGVFSDEKLLLQFRFPSKQAGTSDQFGIFFKSVLRENGIDPSRVKGTAICSVVPSSDYSIRAAFIKYFGHEPFYLHGLVNTGITLNLDNPKEMGPDRLALCMGARAHVEEGPLMIVDFGTATTVDI